MSSVLVMYSKEFEANGLPWRVEDSKATYYLKHVYIEVPSSTVYRANATPAYVLKCEGQVQYHPEKQSAKIVSSR